MQPVKVKFNGRLTGMGASTQYYVYSLKQKKQLLPSRTESSRTHWSDYYFLLPAKYLLIWRDISNLGNHHCGSAIISVNADGTWQVVQHITIPQYAYPACMCQKKLNGE